MSTEITNQWPPLVSAADVNEANYVRARFDDNLAWIVRDMGRCRAPNEDSIWRHTVGYAGEIATAAYLGVRPNQTITAEYVGDEGYDLMYRGNRVEVKTVTKEEDLQLRIPKEKIDKADYFVLARCSHPSELVELIGYTNRDMIKRYGDEHPTGDIQLGLRHLHTFEPVFLPPDRIRERIGARSSR